MTGRECPGPVHSVLDRPCCGMGVYFWLQWAALEGFKWGIVVGHCSFKITVFWLLCGEKTLRNQR